MARRFDRTPRNSRLDRRAGGALGPAFASVLEADFARHGAKRIRTLRKKQPYDYLKFVAALIPRDFGTGPAEAPPMTEEEFASMLEALRAAAAKHDRALARAKAMLEPGGAQAPPRSQPPGGDLNRS